MGEERKREAEGGKRARRGGGTWDELEDEQVREGII